MAIKIPLIGLVIDTKAEAHGEPALRAKEQKHHLRVLA